MKKWFVLLTVFLAVFLVSCSGTLSSSRETNSLALELTVEPKIAHSIHDIRVEIFLTNQSNERVLVHKRLTCQPFPLSPGMTELYLRVFDTSGNLLLTEPRFFTLNNLPSEDTLAVLEPGEQIRNVINLNNFGYKIDMIVIRGMKYTIVAIYQNYFDITKNFSEGPSSAWVGTIHSNEETFVILP